jgi:mRNA interferase RelE/StbE
LSKFRLFETDQFLSDIESLPKKNREKIQNKIRLYAYTQITENPFFGLNIKKLKDYKPETWRYRIGKHRLFYEIDDKEKIIFLIALDDRKDAY